MKSPSGELWCLLRTSTNSYFMPDCKLLFTKTIRPTPSNPLPAATKSKTISLLNKKIKLQCILIMIFSRSLHFVHVLDSRPCPHLNDDVPKQLGIQVLLWVLFARTSHSTAQIPLPLDHTHLHSARNCQRSIGYLGNSDVRDGPS